jgi:hypothetical protein
VVLVQHLQGTTEVCRISLAWNDYWVASGSRASLQLPLRYCRLADYTGIGRVLVEYGD